MISYWATEHEVIETRVSLPTTTHEIANAIAEIERSRDGWGTDPIDVRIDGEAIVFSFPGSTKSVGRKAHS